MLHSYILSILRADMTTGKKVASEVAKRHCHGTSGLRSLWRFGTQGDEENQLPRVPVLPAAETGRR
jgi:hypothetical protein